MSKNAQEKQDTFKRLAVPRMNKWIKESRKLANLGNTNNYEGTPQQKQKMLQVIKSEVSILEKALLQGNTVAEGFQF